MVSAQVSQKPVKAIIQGKVVNLTEIAARQNQNQIGALSATKYPKNNNAQHSAANIAPSSLHQTKSLRASDSVPASPAPRANFAGQYFDGYTVCNPSGAVSENYLASMANYQMVVQDRLGNILLEVNPYNIWASSFSIGYIYQNRLEYDPYSQRWILACFSDEYTDSAGVLVGISQTDDPRGNWNLFKVPAGNPGTTYVDFPDLGFNKNFVALTGGIYAVNGTGGDTSYIYVFDKNAMINNQPVSYSRLIMQGTKNSVAQTYDSSINDLYILQEWNNNHGQMELLDITGNADSAAVSVVAYPTSSVPHSNNPTFDFAPQMDTGLLLQTGDDKPNSLVYANGTLWCAQTVFLPYGNPTRSSVQWWQIDTTGSILQLGLIDDSTDGFFYAFGSIAVNKNNDALIGYSVFSPSIHPSGGYAYHDHNQPAGIADSSRTYIAGLSMYIDTSNGNQNEWGQLSSTVIDPYDNLGFWTIQSYAASTANTWGAWWADVDNYCTGINTAPPLSSKVPNPNNGNFNLQIQDASISSVEVNILNMMGETISHTSVSANASLIPIETQGLAKGVYVVQISANGQNDVQKLVIQ